MPAIRIGERIIKFKNEDGFVEIEGNKVEYSVLQAGAGRLVMKIGNNVKEIMYAEDRNTTILFSKGALTKFQVLDDHELILQSLTSEKSIHHDHTEVKAPMHGLVVNVLSKKGDHLSCGDTLMILEAMKMENEIRVPYDSEVAGVFAKVGDIVEKDQVIASLK